MKVLSTVVIGVVTLSLAQTSSTMPPVASLSDKRAAPTKSQHVGPDGAFVFAKLSPYLTPVSQPTQLSLEDRVAYQRAIEEVYWRHRIWPKERPDRKPSLDEVMPPAQLEKEVGDYLRNSEPLEDYWREPLSAEQLQAEMERMAQHTKQPEVLRELFEALGNDPFVIAECLARPALSERLVTNFYATAIVKKTKDRMQVASVEWRKEPFDSWRARSEKQAPMLVAAASANYTLPAISDGPNGCSDDTWTSTTTNNVPSARSDHTAVWTGSEMIVWGGLDGFNLLTTGARYNPGTDSWTATSTTNAPSFRHYHTAVWTGSEMIVWGGGVNTGRRYNPATDTWVATSTTNAPSARSNHTAVWTGSEMIVWGGSNSNTGGRYNPVTDSWTATSTSNVPDFRAGHTAVWTGNEMIVWGGYNTNEADLNTGGRYDPSTDNWTATEWATAPSPRGSHTAVWTGYEMIVWGGYDFYMGPYLNTGGRYNPRTDSWTATSTTNAPSVRDLHTAVWTGSQMIVWGGYNASTQLNTGGRYCAQLLLPQSTLSRKTHGAAGTFDVPLPLTGNVGVECRSGGAANDYQMIINFMNPVTVGSVSMTLGIGSVSSFTVSGPQVTVNLTGVANVQRITVMLFDVNDGTHMGNVPVSMGVLIGDVNGNAAVNASDVTLTKAQVGQPVTGSNFREDVNADGSITPADAAQVTANVGTALPLPPRPLWYNGDFNGINGLANERNTVITQAAVYDDFNVPAGQIWDVAAVFSDNLLNTTVTGADWEIRTGISEGNGGTLVASGTTNSPGVHQIYCGFGFCEYRVEVTELNVTLVPGHYWLNVTPVGNGTGRSFNATTSGVNCVGTPCGDNQNAFFNSTFFGTYFTSTSNEGQPSDFSNGVIGTVVPSSHSGLVRR